MQKTHLILPQRYSTLKRLNHLLSSAKYHGTRFLLILDENSLKYCLPKVIVTMPVFEQSEFVEVPVGEQCKSIEVATGVWHELADMAADHNMMLVNVGGGAVCDLGAFVASCYKRGIGYVNIPTTLVAMVDAAIGGKTAVNLDAVKNVVGTFHNAAITCIDPVFLSTLPLSHHVDGLMEMVKTAAVCNPDLYRTLLEGLGSIDNNTIAETARLKQAVVAADPKDHGIRRILNFGHTFGHAIESHTMTYGKHFTHGQAVGLGMLCAMYLSVKKLGFSEQLYAECARFVSQYVYVPQYDLYDCESLLECMRNDKKNSNGLILCVLLQDLGVPVIDVAVDENEVRDALLQAFKIVEKR